MQIFSKDFVHGDWMKHAETVCLVQIVTVLLLRHHPLRSFLTEALIVEGYTVDGDR